MEHQTEKHLVMVQGNVVVEYAGVTLRTDSAELDTVSGDIKAFGNVQLIEKNSTINADSLEMNLQTLSGNIYNANGVIISTFYLTGKKITWYGKEKFVLEEGSFTSCPGPNPDWIFKTPRSEIRMEDVAIFRGVSFWVKGVPTLYLPYFIIPAKTKRSSGFLFPRFGSSNTDGLVLKNKYFWALNEQMDATIGLDYLSRRGFSPNLEFRYLINEESFGDLSTSYIRDKVSSTDFYNLDWKHQQRWDNEIRNLTRIDIERKGFRQRFEDDLILRTRRTSDSYTFFGKNWSDLAVWFEAELFKTVEVDQRESFSRQPEVSFFYLDRPLGDFPLYFSFDSSYVSFSEEAGPEKNREHRADFLPTVKLPLKFPPYVNLAFSLGLRESVYSKEGAGDTFPRRALLTGMTVYGPILSREYSVDSQAMKSIKHFVEPRLEYRFVSLEDPDKQVPKRKFDIIDEEGNSNIVSFELSNRFLAKSFSETAINSLWQIANLNLGIDYDIAETRKENDQTSGPKRPFSPIRLDLKTFFPVAWELNFDASYDPDEGKFDSRNLQFSYHPKENFEISIEKRFTSSQNLDYLIGKIRTDLSRKVALTWSVRYDEENNRLAENNIRLEYRASCWSIHFSLIRRLDATKFFFHIDLKGLG